MAPTIVLVRHAQALHNDHSFPDPVLTLLGEQQCAPLRQSLLERFGEVDPKDIAIVASPMRRTLQTAMLSTDWLVEKGVTIEANADWQELDPKPCDTGSPVSQISPDFPKVDFSKVDPIWPDKTSPAASRYFASSEAIVQRGLLALKALYHRPEKYVLVFSHAGFLRLGCVGWWFFNSDYRIFEFDGEPSDEIPDRGLKQDKATVKGGLGLSSTQRAKLGVRGQEPPAEEK